jgi:hypothetical protein
MNIENVGKFQKLDRSHYSAKLRKSSVNLPLIFFKTRGLSPGFCQTTGYALARTMISEKSSIMFGMANIRLTRSQRRGI